MSIRPAWGGLTTLSLASVPFFLGFFGLMAALPEGGRGIAALADAEALRPAAFLALVLFPALHELLHGLLFRAFGLRPSFGVRVAYLYTTAERQVLPRNPYLLVGAGPFLGISLLGAALLLWPPLQGLLLLPLATHAAGSMGDLWIVARVLRCPPHALVMDLKDGADVYLPAATPD